VLLGLILKLVRLVGVIMDTMMMGLKKSVLNAIILVKFVRKIKINVLYVIILVRDYNLDTSVYVKMDTTTKGAKIWCVDNVTNFV